MRRRRLDELAQKVLMPSRRLGPVGIGCLAVVLIASCTLEAEGELVSCIYLPRESAQNRTPEIGPHENCAEITRAGFPSIGSSHLEAAHYTDGFASFLVEGQWYYVKRDGTLLPVLAQDNGPDSWSEGLVRTFRGGKIAYADRSLELVVPAVFDFGWPFRNGRALVCKGCRPGKSDGEHTPIEGGTWGYIDTSGQEVVPVQFSRIEAQQLAESTAKP